MEFIIENSSFIRRCVIVSVNGQSVLIELTLGEREYEYDVPKAAWLDAVKYIRNGGSYGKAYHAFIKSYPYK